MSEGLVTLSSLADQPIYNIKAVCKRTGLTIPTLRAWERRYGVPLPRRTEQGYRMYSDRDVAMLHWLIEQAKLGISISHAAQHLFQLLQSNTEVSVVLPAHPTHHLFAESTVVPDMLRSPDAIGADLITALIHMDDQRVQMLFNEAMTLFTSETALIDVVQQSLYNMRQQAADGEINAAALSFAHNIIRRRLISLLQLTPVSHQQRSAFVAGFANEHTETDMLLLCLLMRKNGYRFSYVGDDLDPSMFDLASLTKDGGMLVFYVDQPTNAERLTGLHFPTSESAIIGAFCGLAGQLEPELIHRLPQWVYLGADMRSIVQKLAAHLMGLTTGDWS